ncbi:MAG: LysM peptidoglycan-binding domain-containing protein [Candidatus Margulisbacteria bacterium]|nr:LysM peptidoglycan-binding domain-containing protein [Candidatus Margulisiibacteriota bacterium]
MGVKNIKESNKIMSLQPVPMNVEAGKNNGIVSQESAKQQSEPVKKEKAAVPAGQYEGSLPPSRFAVKNVEPLIAILLLRYEKILKSDGIKDPQKFLEDLSEQLTDIEADSDARENLIGYVIQIQNKYEISAEQQLPFIRENYDPEFKLVSLGMTNGLPFGQLNDNLQRILQAQPTYTIQNGDTLNKIIDKINKETGYKITLKEVCELNDISNPDKIIAGVKLKLPNIPVDDVETLGLRALFSEEDNARLQLALDGMAEHPQVTALIGRLTAVFATKYFAKMDDLLELKNMFLKIVIDNADEIKELLDITNNPQFSPSQREKSIDHIIRSICGINMIELEEKISDVDIKQRKEAVALLEQSITAEGIATPEAKRSLARMREINELGENATPAQREEWETHRRLVERWLKSPPESTTVQEYNEVADEYSHGVFQGVENGFITPEEAQKSLAQIFAAALQFFGLAAEYVKFVQTDPQVQANAARSDENCLVYLKRLLTDASYISQFIAEKNAKEEKEQKLAEKRQELASLNIPKSIRALIAQIYGIDFENIDGAVARTIAEKVSRNENPLS